MRIRSAQNLSFLLLLLCFVVPHLWASARDDLESCREAGERENWQLVITHCSRFIVSGKPGRDGLANAYSYRGVANSQLKKHKSAIEDLGAALKLNPNNKDLLLIRGKSYAMLRFYNEAIQDFSRVIQLDSSNKSAYDYRGNAYSELGQFGKAISDFDRAIKLDPKSASAYNNRGLTFMEMGDLDRAISDLKRSLELEPGNKYAKHNLQLTQARKRQRAIYGTSRAKPLRNLTKQRKKLPRETKKKRGDLAKKRKTQEIKSSPTSKVAGRLTDLKKQALTQPQPTASRKKTAPALQLQAAALPEAPSPVHVDMETASLVVSTVDLLLQVGEDQLEIRRSLNQLDPKPGLFGKNWHLNWEARLSRIGAVVVIERDQEENLFVAAEERNVYTNNVGERVKIGVDGSALYVRSNGEREGYNPDGRLVEVARRNGNSFTLHYDSGGKLRRIQGPGGMHARLKWDKAGRIVSIEGSNGNLVEFRYEGNFLVQVRLNNEQIHAYSYTDQGLVASITDSNHRVTEIGYDKKGRVIRHSRPGEGDDVYSYDDFSQRITRTDRAGMLTMMEFNQDGLQYKVTDAKGNHHLYGYNKKGRIQSVKSGMEQWQISYNEAGQIQSLNDGAGTELRYGYDKRGNLVYETTPLGGEIRREYDQLNQVTSVIDERGGKTHITYVPDSSQISSIAYPDGSKLHYRYDSAQRLTELIDADGESTSYKYDQAGRLVSENRPGRPQLTYTYDAASNISEIREGDRSLVRYKRAPSGNILSEIHSSGLEINYQYDAKGNVKSWNDNTGGGERIGYDAKGRQQWSMDSKGGHNSFEYDAANNLVATKDPMGNQSRAAYTTQNRLKQLSNALGRSANYSYDSSGRLQRIETPTKGTMAFSYDVLGNILTTTDPLGRISKNTYDHAGQLISSIDAAGSEIRYRYDSAGRVIEKLLPGNRTIRYGYDGASRLLSMNDGEFPINYEYGRFGRLARIAYPALDVDLKYRYGPNGQISGFTGPKGKEVTYRYDASGRMQSMRLPGGGRIKFEHDPRGRLVSIKYPNGIRGIREYDALGNTLAVAYVNTLGEVVKSWNYSYDSLGNLIGARNELGYTTKYRHDANGQLIEEQSNEKSLLKYGYSPGGNRKQLAIDGKVISYRFDTADQIQQAGDDQFKHDANGNLIQRSKAGEVTSYSYSSEGMLTSVNLPDGKKVQFGYAPSGERTWREDIKGKIHYVTDGTHLLATLGQDKQLLTSFYHGPGIDHPVAMRHEGELFYYLLDGLGSVAALVDAAGRVVASYTTDAYGNLKQSTGDLPNPFIFTAREFDPDTGLYYYRARYYDPTLGRFLTKDPAGLDLEDLASLNPYLYVGNAPLRFTDPWGLTPTPTNVVPAPPLSGHTQPYGVPVREVMHGPTRPFHAPGTGPSSTPTSASPAPAHGIGPSAATRNVHLVNTRPSPAPSQPLPAHTQPYRVPGSGGVGGGATRPNVIPGTGPSSTPTVAAPRPGFWNLKHGWRQARDFVKQRQHEGSPGLKIISGVNVLSNVFDALQQCKKRAKTAQQMENCVKGVLKTTGYLVVGGTAAGALLVYLVPVAGPPLAVAGILLSGAQAIVKVGTETYRWIRDKNAWQKIKENSEYFQDKLGKKDKYGKTFLDKLTASVKKKIEEIRKLAQRLRDTQDRLDRGWQSVQALGKRGDAELKRINRSLAKIEQLVKICQQHKKHLNTIVDTARQEVERHLQIIEKATDRLIDLAALIPPVIPQAEELVVRIGKLRKKLEEKENAVKKLLRRLDLSFTATSVRYPVRVGKWIDTHVEQYRTKEMKDLRRSIATLDRMVTEAAKVPSMFWPPEKYVRKMVDVGDKLIRAREDGIAKLDRARELAKLCDIDIDARIQLTKKASSSDVLKDDEVVYTYTVKNIGNAILTQVSVTDDKCNPVTRTKGDDKLDPDETWSFDCAVTLTATTTNTATASAVDPDGKTIKSGPQSVTVKVSSNKVKVPYLLGLNRDAATYDVEQAGLKPNAKEDHGPLPKGDVFKQHPQPETVVKKGSTVEFWISKGPAPKVRTLYLDPPMQKIKAGEVASIRALLVFESGDEEDVTRTVTWSWFPDRVIQKLGPGSFGGRNEGRVVVTAREKRGTGVASITVEEEERTKWDKPISHADELKAKALPPPPDAFTWYALCDKRSGEVRYGEDTKSTRYRVLGGPFQGPRDAKLWIKQNYPDWRCTDASNRYGKWNVLCNKQNLSVGIGKGTDPTRFWIMQSGFVSEKGARAWVQQNCPAWQCSEGGACSDKRRGGPWSVVCSKRHGGIGLTKHPNRIKQWLFADNFFSEKDARRWVESNCPSWRCNRDGQCLPGRRVPRDKPLELPPEAKRGQFGDWKLGRGTHPKPTTKKSLGSLMAGNWSGTLIEEDPRHVRCTFSVNLRLDASMRGRLTGRLASENILDPELRGMGPVCPRSVSAPASLSVTGSRAVLSAEGRNITLAASKNKLSVSRVPISDGFVSISLRKR